MHRPSPCYPPCDPLFRAPLDCVPEDLPPRRRPRANCIVKMESVKESTPTSARSMSALSITHGHGKMPQASLLQHQDLHGRDDGLQQLQGQGRRRNRRQLHHKPMRYYNQFWFRLCCLRHRWILAHIQKKVSPSIVSVGQASLSLPILKPCRSSRHPTSFASYSF